MQRMLVLRVCLWWLPFALMGCVDPWVTALPTPAAIHTSAPNLSTDYAGRAVLSWQRKAQETTVLEYAVLTEGVWSKPTEVARGTNWFVNWADIPAVQPINDKFWVAHYLQKTPGGKYAYDVQLRLSTDGGRTWRDAGRPHTDDTLSEHGFVSMFPDGDRLGLVWLDGRESKPPQDSSAHHSSHGAMTLRSAHLDSQGRLHNEQLVDARVCDCCPTAASWTASGPLVVYRDRSAGEIRDIASSRLQPQGWTEPQPVSVDGWHTAGCPVNGPALAVQQKDVAVLWYSGAERPSKVFLARSADGGATYGRKLKVNKQEPLGRVTMVMHPDRSLVLLWLQEDAPEQAWLVARYVSADNELGEIKKIVRVSPERFSGFPKLINADSKTVLAWTHVASEGLQVRTLIIDEKALKQ